MVSLGTKLGFQLPKPGKCQFAPPYPWANDQEVTITPRVPLVAGSSMYPSHIRRQFQEHLSDDPWETEEILLPSDLTKEKIWEHIKTLRALPDLSHFVVYAGRQEVTKLDRWPAGLIALVTHTFLVTWQVEDPQGGFVNIIQENMTPLISPQEAWQLLHHDHPRLFSDASFNYRGNLKPGQIIQAEVIKKDVVVSVDFETIRKGHLRFTQEWIPNMVSWADIHTHFQARDRRIPPFDCYVQEENRPYIENTELEFRSADEVEVPDMFG
jgi:hypothetical protein